MYGYYVYFNKDQSINQPTNQPTNQSINQSLTQGCPGKWQLNERRHKRKRSSNNKSFTAPFSG